MSLIYGALASRYAVASVGFELIGFVAVAMRSFGPSDVILKDASPVLHSMSSKIMDKKAPNSTKAGPNCSIC